MFSHHLGGRKDNFGKMEMDMMYRSQDFGLETKFAAFDGRTALTNGSEISGYASVFGAPDQSGDIVQSGAYQVSLAALAREGRCVKMLWQHDPTRPIGVWDDIHEDGKGLFVKGRILPNVQGGAEAIALIEAGAIDGLSIGYRTLKSEKKSKKGRLLHELDLWEVSLVTFPMLPQARVLADTHVDADLADDLAAAFAAASDELSA